MDLLVIVFGFIVAAAFGVLGWMWLFGVARDPIGPPPDDLKGEEARRALRKEADEARRAASKKADEEHAAFLKRLRRPRPFVVSVDKNPLASGGYRVIMSDGEALLEIREINGDLYFYPNGELVADWVKREIGAYLARQAWWWEQVALHADELAAAGMKPEDFDS